MRPLAVSAMVLIAVSASAHHDFLLQNEPYSDIARVAEIASLDERLMYRAEPESRRRAMIGERLVTEARIEMLRRRLEDYSRVNRFRTGNALPIAEDETRLALLRERLYLRDLDARWVEQERQNPGPKIFIAPSRTNRSLNVVYTRLGG